MFRIVLTDRARRGIFEEVFMVLKPMVKSNNLSRRISASAMNDKLGMDFDIEIISAMKTLLVRRRWG